jgi:hypothetical protein
MGETIGNNQINVRYLENDSQKQNVIIRTINTKRNNKNDNVLTVERHYDGNGFENQVKESDCEGF